MGRYDLTDFEWRVIEPLLPNKPRGVARVDDRRVLNGILWVLRSGAPWRDLPEHYGPYTTCYNRFNRDTIRRALAVPGAGQALNLQCHQPLGREADHLAKHIGIGALLQKRAQGHHVLGHRGSPSGQVGLH